MIPESVKQYLFEFHKYDLKNIRPVGGGSINDAYSYSIQSERYFVKFNNQIKGIIERELEGLSAIREFNCIATPKIISFAEVDEYEILILEFVERGDGKPKVWETFGRQLAKMHAVPVKQYGWDRDNFIGSLPQQNLKTDSFIDFFIHQRLEKQITLANKNGLLIAGEVDQFTQLFKKLPELLPDSRPSLVHGDLWGGNMILGQDDVPYLIDPSVHHNFRETDIAFTHLFGRFDQKFYDAYREEYPLESGFTERIPLYNLYPLLVHLNLFGNSYHHSVITNLQKYV